MYDCLVDARLYKSDIVSLPKGGFEMILRMRGGDEAIKHRLLVCPVKERPFIDGEDFLMLVDNNRYLLWPEHRYILLFEVGLLCAGN